MKSDHFLNRNGDTFRAGGADVAWNESGGEIVVLDLDTSVYFGLNATGALLWKRLTAGANRDDLVVLVEQLGVDGARAGHDVDQFLAALDRCGLLQAS
jgi:hypothetical protein